MVPAALYSYDNRNKLVSEVKSDGSELVYGYDEVGNRITLSTIVNGIADTATYTFDELNRMSSVTDDQGNVTSYSFDENSNQKRIDQANGTATTMVFDELNRVTTISHLGTSNETLSELIYTLDDSGRRTAITESSGRSSSYTYDELYRLTGESIDDPQVGNHSTGYGYDEVSNRISDSVNGVSSTYTYDDNDRLTTHGFDSYSYDDNGNTISEVVEGQSNSYTYNSQNRLIEANMGGVVQAMVYDPDGVRIQKTVSGATTDYLTDTNRDYSQVLVERSPTADLRYTFGLDLVGLSTGVKDFTYHTDALGSTRLLTDELGIVADDVRYDAWGELLSGGDVLENQYLYTGEQFDSGLGKTYLRARYYDSGVGRFSQMDEFAGWVDTPVSLNKYTYAGGDPVLYYDPTGYAFTLNSLMQSITAQSTGLTAVAGKSGGSFAGRTLMWNGACFVVNELAQATLEQAVTHYVGIYVFTDLDKPGKKPYVGQSRVNIINRIRAHFRGPKAAIESMTHFLPVSVAKTTKDSIDDVITSLEQMFIDRLGGPTTSTKDGGTSNARNERDLSLTKNAKYKKLIDKFEICPK